MLFDALRHIADWGSGLVGTVLGFSFKDLALIASILMGGTWFVASEFNARDERTAATESDVRLLSQSVDRLSGRVADLSEQQDGLGRRMIRYHQIYMQQVEGLADKLDREIDMPPPPYQGGNG